MSAPGDLHRAGPLFNLDETRDETAATTLARPTTPDGDTSAPRESLQGPLIGLNGDRDDTAATTLFRPTTGWRQRPGAGAVGLPQRIRGQLAAARKAHRGV
jgi:hypothetical protein